MRLQKVIADGKKILIVEGVLEHLKLNKKAHFAITGSIWKCREGVKVGRDCLTCGCIHDDILREFPELSDFVAMHLAHEDGTPTYAFANGWYWMEKGRFDYVASLMRITETQALKLKCLTKEQFAEYVELQTDRWKAEAEALIKKYNLKVKVVN